MDGSGARSGNRERSDGSDMGNPERRGTSDTGCPSRGQGFCHHGPVGIESGRCPPGIGAPVSSRWWPGALRAAAVVGSLALVTAVAQGCTSAPKARGAIIVDQLSENAPNPGFVARARSVLEAAGFKVDYVAGPQVTVRFLQSLPTRQDDVVLLRMHSARIVADGLKSDDVALFTGELIDLGRYELSDLPPGPATAVAAALASRPPGAAPPGPGPDTLSLEEQSRLIPVFYDPEQHELPRFGLRPLFIERDLRGDFKPGCVVILMGCDGLRSSRLAEAFVRRGALAFVSWDQPVSAGHTDLATLRLLESWLSEGRSLSEAVEWTMDEVGPDPEHHSRLVVYPQLAPGGQ